MSSKNTSSQLWQKKDGIIRFTIEADRTTGPDWGNRLKKNGIPLGRGVEKILHSPDFEPISNGTLEIAVIKKEDENLSGINWTETQSRDEAKRLGLLTPNPDLECYFLEKFTIEAIKGMDLDWIRVMHSPIVHPEFDFCLLGETRYEGEPRTLSACHLSRDTRHYRLGFAFLVPQD
jgi:hypothetical protein